MSIKIPIEPATFRIIAQCLYLLNHRVPHSEQVGKLNSWQLEDRSSLPDKEKLGLHIYAS
jgi:hypothetical protein